jgi:hypothetical protein
VAVGELLLELTGETGADVSWILERIGIFLGESLPLLHTVETLKGWDGDKDDNSLLAVANLNLH